MRKKKPAKKSKPLPPKPQPKEVDNNDEKPFDFGGIPTRDLKKNLGCG
jgi:hypothetical protein